MRVIAGAFKGRHLKAVSGMNTRPTTDKVKESVFQMIGPYFDGGLGLDLFAGSGSLGIEALSRGLHRCIFIDVNGKAIQTIKQNLASLSLMEDSTEVYKADAKRALKACAKRKLSFDFIAMDPPYKLHYHKQMLEEIEKLNLLNGGGWILCEHDSQDTLTDTKQLSVVRKETYGTIGITIYRKQ